MRTQILKALTLGAVVLAAFLNQYAALAQGVALFAALTATYPGNRVPASGLSPRLTPQGAATAAA